MYTYSKHGRSTFVEKNLTRKGDNFASIRIEVAFYDGKMSNVHVSAFSASFGEKSRHHSQFFEGDNALRDGWKLFKGFQCLLGGDFND